MKSDVYKQMQTVIKEKLDLSVHTSDEQLRLLIEQTVLEYAEHDFLTIHEKEKLVNRIFNSFRGLDILQPLLDDPQITEIMVNGCSHIFIERDGGIVQVQDQFESESKLEDIIQSIVAKVNRIVNQSSPIVDARLLDGSRVHVVLPPISLVGPSLTIRKFPENWLSMDRLVQLSSISLDAAELLRCMVESGYNMLISGGTGSGKTTLLNALSAYIPAHERIISIEDSAELKLDRAVNLVRLETRNMNTEGKGEVSIRDLIRAALRMRPNRIIVGEVRGAEAVDMLQAMNTGHDGSLTSAHANTAKDMLNRLEMMVLSGAPLPVEVIRSQIGSAINLIIHVNRLRDRTRRVTEIHEVQFSSQGHIVLNPLFVFKESSNSTSQFIDGKLEYTGNPFTNVHKLKMSGISFPPWFNTQEEGEMI